MATKRYAAFGLSLVFLFVCVCGFAGTSVFGAAALEEEKDKNYRYGYGWVNADLVIRETDPKSGVKSVEETVPGVVMMKQTCTKFRVQIDMLDNWTIMKSRIYISMDDQVPMAGNKTPVTALFPYKEVFSTPVDSYELLLDPVADLGIESFQGRKGEKINIVVYTQVKSHDTKGKTIVKDAWARGYINGDPDFGQPETPDGAKKAESIPLVADETDICLMVYEILDENENDMFRKNTSKNPECATTKAKIEIMHYYVQARAANGDPVELGYKYIETMVTDDDGNPILDEEGNLQFTEGDQEIRNVAKPLISVYAEEVPGNNYPSIVPGEINCASDVFGSVSLDEGYSWKVTNLSRAADRSSFTLKPDALGADGLPDSEGFEYPGEVKKPNVKQNGNNILVAWTSKYARSGSPTYSLPKYLPLFDTEGNPVVDAEGNPVYSETLNPYYEDDIWGVGGAQRSKDYTDVEQGFPGIEIPYSAVWVCRGFVQRDGTFTWMKPERLTSGRRDAAQVAIAASPAGFAVTWQEDPDGMRPGGGDGPGDGWSGATTNHKSDIWYSYIAMEDFQKIDEDFVSKGEPSYDPEDEEKGKGRPKALVPMKLPVRISDNDTLNLKNMKISSSQLLPYDGSDYPAETIAKLWVLREGNIVYDSEEETTEDVTVLSSEEDGNSGDGEGEGKGDALGAHRYGLETDLLWREDSSGRYILFYEKESHSTNGEDTTRYVAVTADDVLLDGNTGASRPNIMLQNYTKDGVTSAWAILGYEEGKGTGSGPPDKEEESEIITITGTGDGTGTGNLRYYPDRGKNVIYHSFDFQKPTNVSAGDILNPQEVIPERDETTGEIVYDTEGNPANLTLSYLVDEEGIPILNWKGDPMPNYENARRPRFIIQSKANAIAGDGVGTAMVCVFKMGLEGKGRPSDIFMVRWETSTADTGNPYKFANVVRRDDPLSEDPDATIVDWQNISSITALEYTEEETQKGDPFHRIYNWEQTEDNLGDYSWEEWELDARAHRGFLKGDFLAIAYDFTPNWRQARNGHDIFNCYIRRSFDGGITWTTDPDGDGTTQYEILKTITGTETETDGMVKTTFDRFVKVIDTLPGEFQPAQNVSLIKNNKSSVIEPRLVGVPGTTYTVLTDELSAILGEGFAPYKTDAKGTILFPEDVQDTQSFWMTYGTESTEEDGGPLDIYYSYSTDRGESFFTEAEPTFLKVPGTETFDEDNPFYTFNWLAKDRRGIEMEQAECQIRMTPDGSVFYAIWNEASEEGSDAIFRRILRRAAVGEISSIERIYEKPVPVE